jgi:hypothetical protein
MMHESVFRGRPSPGPAAETESKHLLSKVEARSGELGASTPRIIAQAKLSVGPADDVYEREADAVADRVVRSLAAPTGATAVPDGSRVQRSATAGSVSEAIASAPRIGRVRRSATVGVDGGALDSDTEAEITSTRGGGRAMRAAARTSMEGAFGADFGHIRIHEGSKASELNDRIQAKAFTVGSDIYFRDGAPDTSSREGQHLLAHELTHTVQQGGGVQRSTEEIQRLRNPFKGLFGGKKKKEVEDDFDWDNESDLEEVHKNPMLGSDEFAAISASARASPVSIAQFSDNGASKALKPHLGRTNTMIQGYNKLVKADRAPEQLQQDLSKIIQQLRVLFPLADDSRKKELFNIRKQVDAEMDRSTGGAGGGDAVRGAQLGALLETDLDENQRAMAGMRVGGKQGGKIWGVTAKPDDAPSGGKYQVEGMAIEGLKKELNKADQNVKGPLPDRPGARESQVQYMDAKERKVKQLTVKNGLIYQQGIGLMGKGSQTKYIFVMDGMGQIYSEQKNVVRHHSSFLAGGPVAAAGTWAIQDGRIVSCNASSGHYAPRRFFMNQLIKELESRGADMQWLADAKKSGTADASAEAGGLGRGGATPKALAADQKRRNVPDSQSDIRLNPKTGIPEHSAW